MVITRIYSTPDGHSHFEEVNIPLHDAGGIGFLSDSLTATQIVFRETAEDYDYDWHHAPTRQFVILLDGKIQIDVSSGESRQFGAGDILLLEDTYGRGHRTRTLDGKRRRSIFVALPLLDQIDIVQESSEDSFPASDAPSWTGTAVS